MALGLKSNGKPAAKKAVVGKSKKKTAWWKKAFMGSAVSLLVLSAGFTGYTWWNLRSLKAEAAGYTFISSSGGSNGSTYLYACKTSMSGGYGPVWRIKTYYINYTAEWKSVVSTVTRNGSFVGSTGLWIAPWSSNVSYVYASQLYSDQVTWKDHTGSSQWYAASLTTC